MGDPSFKTELHWYWTCADGELSSPSNYMAMVSAIRLGRASAVSQSATELPEHRLHAATRARRVSRALSRVSDDDRAVLFAAFGPHARELPIFGAAAPVAVLTKAASVAHQASGTTRTLNDWLVRLAWRVSKRQGDRVAQDAATASAIASEAEWRLTNAIGAFKGMRPKSQKSVPGGLPQTAPLHVRAEKFARVTYAAATDQANC
jgi:hypothetical protein